MIEKLLQLLPPETAHGLTLKLLSHSPKCVLPHYGDLYKGQAKKLMGLSFPNPLGIASGFDKNAEVIEPLAQIGFGFVEVGAVTPKAQPGNPKPRLFRLRDQQAIVNYMGFNNKGLDYFVDHLQQTRVNIPIGVNLGKNAQTPLDRAIDDYKIVLSAVYPLVDFVTVNISCPNMKDLLKLQNITDMQRIIAELDDAIKQEQDRHQKAMPVLVKIGPDMSDDALKRLIDCFVQAGVAGVIATNTTKDHPGDKGGLSGVPLFSKALHAVSLVRQVAGNDFVIVGVGGINSKKAAQEMFDAGADLIQVYTGLVYQGLGLVRDILT